MQFSFSTFSEFQPFIIHLPMLATCELMDIMTHLMKMLLLVDTAGVCQLAYQRGYPGRDRLSEGQRNVLR